jgi:Antidote-toxin recognition MazE, bacterial antitoxin
MKFKSKYNMEKQTFLAEELFEDIPGDPDNVLMRIPPAILEAQGWKEGDTLNIEVEDGKMVITKV